MANWEAQKYFKQLLFGIQYLHRKGVAHRDIKPENLLLDNYSNLKISDFGMATVFRLRGQERLLEKRCGTLPYIAPEVLDKPYNAEPADIWSCGVVLIAMLAGGKLLFNLIYIELLKNLVSIICTNKKLTKIIKYFIELPWDSPTLSLLEYKNWVEGKYMLLSPWKKLDNMSLSLIRCILNPNPKRRYSLEKINKHRWIHCYFQKLGKFKIIGYFQLSFQYYVGKISDYISLAI